MNLLDRKPKSVLDYCALVVDVAASAEKYGYSSGAIEDISGAWSAYDQGKIKIHALFSTCRKAMEDIYDASIGYEYRA